MTDPEDIEQRLMRLSAATEAVCPSRDFSARVMLALAPEAPTFLESTWLSARRLLPIAAVAAAMAVGWAVQVDRSVDDALATTYASVELE